MDIDRAVKLAVILGVLLAGFGVFYHYVVFLPGAEREKAAAAAREKEEAEKRDLQRRAAYENCLGTARSLYEADWATACETVAEIQEKELSDCLADRSIMTNQFMGPQYCQKNYAGADPSPNCSLPKARADSLNARFEQSKDRCTTEARLGLR